MVKYAGWLFFAGLILGVFTVPDVTETIKGSLFILFTASGSVDQQIDKAHPNSPFNDGRPWDKPFDGVADR